MEFMLLSAGLDTLTISLPIWSSWSISKEEELLSSPVIGEECESFDIEGVAGAAVIVLSCSRTRTYSYNPRGL